ncbi:hypothetical protein ACFWAY_18050 [Rhodococcus sp. NPDC059968]|uniref:hypothetical protein n=1 Tax=Rhodococcus sp. NPDC059968 TaxID=3347017 RepID=UPI00366D8896
MGRAQHSIPSEARIEGLDADWIGNLIPLRRIFGVWVFGLAMFGLAAIVVIAKTLFTLAA